MKTVLKWLGAMLAITLLVKGCVFLTTPMMKESIRKSVAQKKEEVLAACAERAKPVVATAKMDTIVGCFREHGYTISDDTVRESMQMISVVGEAHCVERSKQSTTRMYTLSNCMRELGLTVADATMDVKQVVYEHCFDLPTNEDFRTCMRLFGL